MGVCGFDIENLLNIDIHVSVNEHLKYYICAQMAAHSLGLLSDQYDMMVLSLIHVSNPL